MDPQRTGEPVERTVVGAASAVLGSGTFIAGRYRLDQLLGSGGMAQVWEAHDETLGRRVAVKVLHPHLAADDSSVGRFRQEAVAAARLSHPGIVGVYDTCSDGTHEAIVMELLDARTLRSVLDERGALDVESVRRIGLRLLDALEAAHRAGLVHRDVKPSNILLCTDGRVKIADFGIAKADDHTDLTREGTLLGTASYLAPEQLTNDPVDGRADLYSLGIVLYECLVGRIPFGGDSGAAVALARLHTEPVDPRRYRSDVPASVADTVMRALQRDPGHRFATAAEFRAALVWMSDDTETHPVVEPATTGATPPPAPQSFGRSERRWLVPALGILMIGAALIVAGLLVRQSTDQGTVPTSTVPPAPEGTGFASAGTFDPAGTGKAGENDGLAPAAIDGDPTTPWRTETYEQPDFLPGKDGVGLLLELEGPSILDRLRIEGSANGWSGEVHLLREGETPDPDAPPAATLTDVRGPVDVALGGERASSVLLWITNLGDGDGAHRVEITEVRPEGRRVG